MSVEDDGKNLMVIDTDCGVDDALAILLALNYSDTWRIIAITCCNGNTTVDNACNNVLKTLHVSERCDIPVYRGCDKPLVPLQNICTGVHGSDGLGNVAHEFSCGSLEISEGHAVNTLVRLAEQYKGKLHLVALAPLTNIAMAHRLDPNFTANLKSFVFMGGNVNGVGNITSSAEFNFAVDPEAAHIVLTETKCPTIMVPWETTLKHPIPWETYNELTLGKSKTAKFVSKMSAVLVAAQKSRGRPGFMLADFLAMAALVEPTTICEVENFPVSAETTGTFTRGMSVIHRRGLEVSKNWPTISIATTMDSPKLISMGMKAFGEV